MRDGRRQTGVQATVGDGSGAVGFAWLALAILVWGSSYWPTEVAGRDSTPLALSALRTLPAAFVLLLVLPAVRSRLPRGRVALWAGVTGLLMVSVFFYGLTEGTVRAGGGSAAVLGNTSPFFVLVLGWLFIGERISVPGAAGLVIGFAGVVLMVSSQLGEGAGAGVAVGLALAMTAAVAWAVGTLVIKWLVGRVPGVDFVGFTAVQYAVGGTALTVLALAADGTSGVSWGSAQLWLPLAYLVVGNAVVGSLAYFAALRRLTATRTAAGLFLVPVVAVLVDIMRGQAPTAVVFAGMALTIAGVGLVNLPTRQVTAPRGQERRPHRAPAAAGGRGAAER